MTYHAAIERLASTYAGVDAQRAEAGEWYDRQVAAAARAEREAAAAVEAAQRAVDAATEMVERIDAEAEEVWRTTVRRLGPAAARYGDPLTLTTRLHDHRHHPSVATRLLAASDLSDLLARHAELFEGLAFPDA